jgi:hypothetical protein
MKSIITLLLASILCCAPLFADSPDTPTESVDQYARDYFSLPADAELESTDFVPGDSGAPAIYLLPDKQDGACILVLVTITVTSVAFYTITIVMVYRICVPYGGPYNPTNIPPGCISCPNVGPIMN